MCQLPPQYGIKITGPPRPPLPTAMPGAVNSAPGAVNRSDLYDNNNISWSQGWYSEPEPAVQPMYDDHAAAASAAAAAAAGTSDDGGSGAAAAAAAGTSRKRQLSSTATHNEADIVSLGDAARMHKARAHQFLQRQQPGVASVLAGAAAAAAASAWRVEAVDGEPRHLGADSADVHDVEMAAVAVGPGGEAATAEAPPPPGEPHSNLSSNTGIAVQGNEPHPGTGGGGDGSGSGGSGGGHNANLYGVLRPPCHVPIEPYDASATVMAAAAPTGAAAADATVTAAAAAAAAAGPSATAAAPPHHTSAGRPRPSNTVSYRDLPEIITRPATVAAAATSPEVLLSPPPPPPPPPPLDSGVPASAPQLLLQGVLGRSLSDMSEYGNALRFSNPGVLVAWNQPPPPPPLLPRMPLPPLHLPQPPMTGAAPGFRLQLPLAPFAAGGGTDGGGNGGGRPDVLGSCGGGPEGPTHPGVLILPPAAARGRYVARTTTPEGPAGAVLRKSRSDATVHLGDRYDLEMDSSMPPQPPHPHQQQQPHLEGQSPSGMLPPPQPRQQQQQQHPLLQPPPPPQQQQPHPLVLQHLKQEPYLHHSPRAPSRQDQQHHHQQQQHHHQQQQHHHQQQQHHHQQQQHQHQHQPPEPSYERQQLPQQGVEGYPAPPPRPGVTAAPPMQRTTQIANDAHMPLTFTLLSPSGPAPFPFPYDPYNNPAAPSLPVGPLGDQHMASCRLHAAVTAAAAAAAAAAVNTGGGDATGTDGAAGTRRRRRRSTEADDEVPRGESGDNSPPHADHERPRGSLTGSSCMTGASERLLLV
ncbi:hypothetical protein VOLCADRAFT_88482 [Volvox carteri f. nagariensis]|uniref:Uncharacterized protein n=1 Tax=Volvox carteri f. nagariensis TaxID=3068 RepID=D8TP42_VOLCA|nr:uncharacterized protein VOLCADRAFT_88482 [Volvox carteri f. nagariensis]EFJ50555.1 hypothetical protein VOLCADRAFT_88482 [Volvox carteri f. nagariensis]|eukprot:XP_002948148.1 hypothetical protein VOLCADRAFT_88482 [Volvox carteri f. nagariensis]